MWSYMNRPGSSGPCGFCIPHTIRGSRDVFLVTSEAGRGVPLERPSWKPTWSVQEKIELVVRIWFYMNYDILWFLGFTTMIWMVALGITCLGEILGYSVKLWGIKWWENSRGPWCSRGCDLFHGHRWPGDQNLPQVVSMKPPISKHYNDDGCNSHPNARTSTKSGNSTNKTSPSVQRVPEKRPQLPRLKHMLSLKHPAISSGYTSFHSVNSQMKRKKQK